MLEQTYECPTEFVFQFFHVAQPVDVRDVRSDLLVKQIPYGLNLSTLCMFTFPSRIEKGSP